MVVYEDLQNGLVKAYSDSGFKIRGGNPELDYNAAVDNASYGRIYKETDIPIDTDDEDDEDATEADYIEALQLLGVEVSDNEKENP